MKTDLEQEIWSECSHLLANCVILYNASILSELLERKERQNDVEQAEQIKRISQVSWKHVNFYGKYTFRDIGAVIDLMQIVNTLEAFRAEAPGNGD